MKKFFIATILAVAAVLPASAQVRSLDMKANLRSDFGLGIGVTFQLPRNFEFAPSLNYYFNDSNTLTIDGDFRYRFELPRNFSLYQPRSSVLPRRRLQQAGCRHRSWIRIRHQFTLGYRS